jgi:hypothetical protein
MLVPTRLRLDLLLESSYSQKHPPLDQRCQAGAFGETWLDSDALQFRNGALIDNIAGIERGSRLEEHDSAKVRKYQYGSILKLTTLGRRAPSGREDAVKINGIDRWIGGVHLQGTRVRWRWSPQLDTIVSGG